MRSDQALDLSMGQVAGISMVTGARMSTVYAAEAGYNLLTGHPGAAVVDSRRALGAAAIEGAVELTANTISASIQEYNARVTYIHELFRNNIVAAHVGLHQAIQAMQNKTLTFLKNGELRTDEALQVYSAVHALVTSYNQKNVEGALNEEVVNGMLNTFDQAIRIPRLEENKLWAMIRDTFKYAFYAFVIATVMIGFLIICSIPQLTVAAAASITAADVVGISLYGGAIVGAGAGAGTFLAGFCGLFSSRASFREDKEAISTQARSAIEAKQEEPPVSSMPSLSPSSLLP